MRLSCAKTGGPSEYKTISEMISLLTRMPTIRTQSPHIYLKWLLSSKFETGGFIWVQDEGRIGRAHPKHKINVYTHR